MDPLETAGKEKKKDATTPPAPATPPAAVPEVQKKKRQWKPRTKPQGTTITGRIDLYDKRGNHCLFFVEMLDTAEGQELFAAQASAAASALKLKLAVLEHGLAIIN